LETHGSPATLKTLPRGDVHIQDHGAESFSIGGKQVQLRKYLVRGLIWGSERSGSMPRTAHCPGEY